MPATFGVKGSSLERSPEKESFWQIEESQPPGRLDSPFNPRCIRRTAQLLHDAQARSYRSRRAPRWKLRWNASYDGKVRAAKPSAPSNFPPPKTSRPRLGPPALGPPVAKSQACRCRAARLSRPRRPGRGPLPLPPRGRLRPVGIYGMLAQYGRMCASTPKPCAMQGLRRTTQARVPRYSTGPIIR